MAEQVDPHLAAVGELVVSVPAPGGHKGERQHPALVQQAVVDIRIVRGNRFGSMSDIELDRAADARLEVDEQQAVLRPEEVSRVRFAVDQLLRQVPAKDGVCERAQTAEQERAVFGAQIRAEVGVTDQPLGFCDSIREAGRGEGNLAEARMESRERAGVLGRGNVVAGDRFVVGSERDREAVPSVCAGLHARVQSAYRSRCLGQSAGNLYLELGARLVGGRGHAGENVAGRQAQRDPVCVLEHDCVLGAKAKR